MTVPTSKFSSNNFSLPDLLLVTFVSRKATIIAWYTANFTSHCVWTDPFVVRHLIRVGPRIEYLNREQCFPSERCSTLNLCVGSHNKLNLASVQVLQINQAKLCWRIDNSSFSLCLWGMMGSKVTFNFQVGKKNKQYLIFVIFTSIKCQIMLICPVSFICLP